MNQALRFVLLGFLQHEQQLNIRVPTPAERSSMHAVGFASQRASSLRRVRKGVGKKFIDDSPQSIHSHPARSIVSHLSSTEAPPGAESAAVVASRVRAPSPASSLNAHLVPSSHSSRRQSNSTTRTDVSAVSAVEELDVRLSHDAPQMSPEST